MKCIINWHRHIQRADRVSIPATLNGPNLVLYAGSHYGAIVNNAALVGVMLKV